MQLQDSFYVMGIIFMSLNILILIGIVVLLYYIKRKISNIHDNIDAKVEEFADFAINPVRKAVDIAASFYLEDHEERTKN